MLTVRNSDILTSPSGGCHQLQNVEYIAHASVISGASCDGLSRLCRLFIDRILRPKLKKKHVKERQKLFHFHPGSAAAKKGSRTPGSRRRRPSMFMTRMLLLSLTTSFSGVRLQTTYSNYSSIVSWQNERRTAARTRQPRLRYGMIRSATSTAQYRNKICRAPITVRASEH